MLPSRHKISCPDPIREVRVCHGGEALISESKAREQLEERFRAGFEAGQKALAEQLLLQRKQLLELQTGVLRSIQNALPGVIADCEQSVVLLAIEAARRVVQNLPVTPQMIEDTVRSALAELQGAATCQVLLHPEDLKMLREVESGLLPAPGNEQVSFQADPSIARGDCLVHTRHGTIAALREQMFQKLETAVLC